MDYTAPKIALLDNHIEKCGDDALWGSVRSKLKNKHLVPDFECFSLGISSWSFYLLAFF
jgi:hypothetical protein